MDSFGPILNFLLITVLGLLIAFSPMLVVVNVIVVLKSARPILRTAVLMAGMIAPLVLVVILAALFLKPDSELGFGTLSQKINIPPIINFAAGVWLLGLAIRRIKYSSTHNGPKKTADLIMKHPPDKLSGLFTFAFIKSLLSVTNLFAVLLVSKLIITKTITMPWSAFAIIWVFLIGLLPFGAIMYFYFFKHERLEVLSEQVDKLLNKNIDFAINLAIAGVGGFLLLSGLINAFRH